MENALSERSESKGVRCSVISFTPASVEGLAHGGPISTENARFTRTVDDAIVVHVSYVYILRCADASLYVGETDNLCARIDKHNCGTASGFTASRRPVALVYSEVHNDRTVARARERQLKRWTRAKKEALIAGDLALLKKL